MSAIQGLWISGTSEIQSMINYEYSPNPTSGGATILNYYNGGADGDGNIGPSYGIVHQNTLNRSQDYLTLESSVGNSPSSDKHAHLTASSAYITKSSGFTGQVSLAYTGNSTVTIAVYDDVNATGAQLASTIFPSINTSAYTDLSYAWWGFARVTFVGTGKSIKISGSVGNAVIDNVVFGTTNYFYSRIPSYAMSGTDNTVTFKRNGTVEAPGSGPGIFSAWCSNPQTTIGDSYWIRATVISGSYSGSATGSWLALSSDRSWTNTGTGQLKIEISSDSSGSTILVSTDTIYGSGNPGLNHIEWI